VADSDGANGFPVGHTYEAAFGSDIFQFRFESENSMTQTGIQGPNKGFQETERITVTPVRDGVFMLTWQESSGTTVVQVADFAEGTNYTNITIPDDDGTVFLRFTGTLKRIE
jgi:hypothetical protein